MDLDEHVDFNDHIFLCGLPGSFLISAFQTTASPTPFKGNCGHVRHGLEFAL